MGRKSRGAARGLIVRGAYEQSVLNSIGVMSTKTYLVCGNACPSPTASPTVAPVPSIVLV